MAGWVDDTEKNFGPDLSLLFKMDEIWSVASQNWFSKIVATRRQILRLKCIKFDFSWGFATDPAGEFTAPPQAP